MKASPEELEEFKATSLDNKIRSLNRLGNDAFRAHYGHDMFLEVDRLRLQEQDKPKTTAIPTPIVAQVANKMKYPDGNPKTQFGIAKPDQWAVDPIAVYEMGLVMMQGMLKYGLYNYYEDPVSISTYVNAARRHLDLYELGQDLDADTNALHSAHLMACGSILVSAHLRGRLIDDRTKNKEMATQLEEYFAVNQERVKTIREKWTGFAEKMRVEKGDKE